MKIGQKPWNLSNSVCNRNLFLADDNKEIPVRGLWSSTMAPMAGRNAVRWDIFWWSNSFWPISESQRAKIVAVWMVQNKREFCMVKLFVQTNIFYLQKQKSTWSFAPLHVASLVESSDPETIAPENNQMLHIRITNQLTCFLCVCICVCVGVLFEFVFVFVFIFVFESNLYCGPNQLTCCPCTCSRPTTSSFGSPLKMQINFRYLSKNCLFF